MANNHKYAKYRPKVEYCVAFVNHAYKDSCFETFLRKN